MWSIRRGEETGAISIMAAVIVLALLVATSLAVDVGRVGYASRDQQGVTDRAVLDGIRVVTAGTHATLADLHGAVAVAVDESLARNPGASAGTAEDRTVTNIQLGTMDGTTFTAICESDQSSTPEYDTAAPTCDGSVADPVDAIRADTESLVSFIFAIGDDDGGRIIRRSSVAATEAVASISVGSRLAEVDLNDSAVADVVNELLGGMAAAAGVSGAEYPTLTAVGYDGLVNATIPLGDIAELDASILSPRSIVPYVEVSLKDLLDVMASSDDVALSAEASSFLGDLAAGVDPAFTVDIGELLYVTSDDEDQAARADLNVWDVLLGSLQVVTFEEGVTLTLSLSDATGGLLGMSELYDVAVDLTVLQTPRTAIGPVRSVREDVDGDGNDDDWWATEARTAQVDLDVQLTTGGSESGIESVFGEDMTDWLGGVIDDLTCLITLGLLCPNSQEQFGITVTAAEAKAGLAGVDCVDPLSDSVIDADAYVATLAARLYHDADGDGTQDGDEDVGDLYEGLNITEPSGIQRVQITPLPGSTTVNSTSPFNVPMLDALLEPALAMMGVDLGTAEVRGNWVDCDSRRLAYVE